MFFVARPAFQLRSLPVPIRWEVTRRHPYYQITWGIVRDAYRNPIPESEAIEVAQQAALAMLGLIGVTDEPWDPARSFADLGGDELNRGWLNGSVQPITLRGMAAILLAYLPKELLGRLAIVFHTAGCNEDGENPENKILAIQSLMTNTASELDTYPDEPLVSINPAASDRKISEAISLLLKQWKQERSIQEQRLRSDKHDEYLEVWDMREGWQDGSYDRSTERTFKEIAQETKRPIGTLSNQYCRAFEMIIGHPYSRELWTHLFGALKLGGMATEAFARTHRPMASPVRRDVPESVLAPLEEAESGDAGSIVKSQSTTSDEALFELVNDIQTMIANGRTDGQIVEEMGVAPEVAAYFRQRGDTFSL